MKDILYSQIIRRVGRIYVCNLNMKNHLWIGFNATTYRDRREERQKRLSKALFRRLATLPLFDFIPLNSVRPLELRDNIDIRDAKWFIYIRMP